MFCRHVVSVAIIVTLFGASTVFMLLSAQNVQSVLDDTAHVHISFCYWLIIIAALLVPLSWLGTPNDFWLVENCVFNVLECGNNQKDGPHDKKTQKCLTRT